MPYRGSSQHQPLAGTQPSSAGAVGGDDPQHGASGVAVHQPVTATDAYRANADVSAIGEISGWGQRYLQNHPWMALNTVGQQTVLGVRTVQYLVVDLFTARFKMSEFVDQAAFVAGTAFIPTALVTIPIAVTLAIQFTLLAAQVGATSLAGAVTGLAVIRQGAPLVAALLLAAAVGSAVCADLGARTMREEIDAMEVMGVSVIRRMVVPRFAALIVIAVLLTGIAIFVGYLAGYLYNVYLQNGAPGSFISSFSSFATVGDLALALVKAVVFGAIVAIISCQKGLSTRGGPAGVANSVNAAVVESVLVLMIVNVALSQLYVIVFPRYTL